MGVNEKLIEVIQKLSDNTDALTSAINESNGKLDTIATKIQDLFDLSLDRLSRIADRDDALYEKVNVMEYSLAQVREWHLDALLNDKFGDVLNVLNSLDNNLAQVRALTGDFISPQLEGILYATSAIGSYQTIQTCDAGCSRPTLMPTYTDYDPLDDEAKCGRVQMFLDKLNEAWDYVLNHYPSGVPIDTQSATIMLGADRLPNVNDSEIPASMISGAVSYLGTNWRDGLNIARNHLANDGPDLIGELYGAQSPFVANQVWQEWTDAHFDNTPAGIVQFWRLFGGSYYMNSLFDPAVTWDTSAYDTSICTASGSQTELTSENCVAAVGNPGYSAYLTEVARPWMDWTATGQAGTDGSVGECILESAFVAGGNINTQQHIAGWGSGAFSTSHRVKLIAASGLVHLYAGTTIITELTGSWYFISPVGVDDLRICGGTGEGEFTVAWQRQIGGVWQAL